jgi:hypothetical protein
MPISYNPANAIQYKEPNLPYLTACVLAGLAVYPLSIALAAPVIALLAAVRNTIFSNDSQILVSLESAILVAVAAAGIGSAIGWLQKKIVSSHFNVDLGRWRLISAFGACLAFWLIMHLVGNKDCLLETMRDPLGDRFYDYYYIMLSFIYTPMIQFAFLLSAIQAIYLYRYVRSAWLWLAANVAAGALFFWLFVYAFAGESFMSWLVAAIVQALLVAYAMRYLLTGRRRGGKAKRKDASFA